MTTTELIAMLRQFERGASGRARCISMYVETNGESVYISDPSIKLIGTGDGCAGAEITLEVSSLDNALNETP